MGRIRWLSLICCASVMAFVVPLVGDEKVGNAKVPRPKEADEFHEVDWDALIGTKESHKENGASLRIFKAVHSRSRLTDVIIIDWSIQYDGPRKPFIVLAPDIERETSGQTELHISAVGKSGKAYRYMCPSPPNSFGGTAPRDWFVFIRRGDTVASGGLTIPTAEVRRQFRKKMPTEFDPEQAPTKLCVQIYHEPKDRGADHKLDAWTGSLISNVVEVKLPEW